MEGINSSTDYTDIFEDMILTDVNNIRKSAILQHLGRNMELASSTAQQLSSANDDFYRIDNEIPENSTFSLHI